jgi:hypothetical protein
LYRNPPPFDTKKTVFCIKTFPFWYTISCFVSKLPPFDTK